MVGEHTSRNSKNRGSSAMYPAGDRVASLLLLVARHPKEGFYVHLCIPASVLCPESTDGYTMSENACHLNWARKPALQHDQLTMICCVSYGIAEYSLAAVQT